MANEQNDLPAGGPNSPGPNKYTDRGTTVDDVSPLPDRSDGTGEETASKRESVSRQLPS